MSAATSAGAAGLLIILVAFSTLGPVAIVAAFVIAIAAYLLMVLGPQGMGEIVLVLALFCSPIFGDRFSISFVTPTDVLLPIGFFLILPQLLQRPLRLPLDYLVGLVLLFTLSVVASLAAGHLIDLSMVRIARFALAILIVPAAFAAWNPPRRMINVLAVAYIAGQCLSTLYPFATGTGSTTRLFGMASHPNAFAVASLLALGLLFYLHGQATTVRQRMWIGAAAILNTAGLIMSGSRGGLLAFVVLVLAVPVLERSGRAAYTLALATVLLVVATPFILAHLGADSAPNRLLHPDASASASGSDAIRGDMLSDGFHEFLQHPIVGSGYSGDYTFYYHNVYLQVAVAAGIFGLLGFLMVCVSLLRTIVARSPLRRLGYCAAAYFMAAIFLNTIWDRYVWTVMSLVLLVHVHGRQQGALSDAPPDDQRAEKRQVYA